MREIFRSIPDWPEYSLSNFGRVRSEQRDLIRSNNRPIRIHARFLAVFDHGGTPSVHVNRMGQRRTLSLRNLMRTVFPTVTGWELSDRIDIAEKETV